MFPYININVSLKKNAILIFLLQPPVYKHEQNVYLINKFLCIYNLQIYSFIMWYSNNFYYSLKIVYGFI